MQELVSGLIELDDGIGIVPPAWNLAVSPEIAVTFGSARMCATPLFSKAWIVELKEFFCPR